MGSPYLSSGESITMTTHRVGVDSVPYDVMLTTHRLTLIDSRYSRFEPLMIAFEDILTVKSGTASSSEPVIILTYTDADDIGREMNLIFLQQPGEHRKRERDIWVKKLMESIIAGRDAPGLPAENPAETDGMQPLVRRWVAPEGIALHTPYTLKETAPPEITIIPDDEGILFERKAPGEPEEVPEDVYSDPVEDYVVAENITPVPPAEANMATPHYDYGEQDEDDTRVTTPAPVPDQDALQKFHTIVIPFVPVNAPVTGLTSPKEEAKKEPERIPAATILAAAQSLAPKEETRETQDEVAVPQAPEVSDTSQEAVTDGGNQPGAGPVPAHGDGHPIPEPVGEIVSGKEKTAHPAIEETSLTGEPEPVTNPSGNLSAHQRKDSETALHAEPGTEVDRVSKESTGREPVAQQISRKPEAPERGSGERRTVSIILGIVALLAMAGAIVLVVSFNPLNLVGSPVTPTTPVLTVQPTTTPAMLSIPAQGAGFRVIYTGEFAGEVGNPGRMKVVSGKGDSFFPVQYNDGLVQASIQKQDNTGNILTVEVYNNGKMIYSRSANTPMAQLDVLVDVRTGSVAGMTPTAENPNPQSTPMYF